MKKTTILLLMLGASAAVLSQDTILKQETIVQQDTVVNQINVVLQDTIVKNSGDEVFGKVTEVSSGSIVYQVTDSVEIINYVILPEDVFMIKYANGTREVIAQTLAEVVPLTTKSEEVQVQKLSPDEMKAKGKSDAKLYYKGTGALLGAAATTTLFPPFGLVEAIVSAAITPQVHAQQVPDVNLLNDKNYVAGYRKQAHKMKVGKVFAGFGIGIATFITWVVVVAQ